MSSGLALGFLVAAQVGPIWLLCARTALRQGLLGGLAVGLGAALVDTAYASLGVAGMARLLELPTLRTALGLAGAAVLLVIGARTLWSAWRPRPAEGSDARAASPLRAFRVSLIATASNPLTIATWAAIFAATAAAGVARSLPGVVGFLGGVGAGSMTWFAILSGGMALLGRHFGRPALRAADLLAGGGLVCFAVLLGWRSLQAG
ncbi:LysE family transporter [Candidatus Nephthysia bennettiae]|uniref:LysE family transporter n=1 Tax=Candidatus Nephthysia bennettiae TaxID=3127016 RepID=A0A934K6P3_9BACT|nr:LysE family transporter [Candidatus Dormibacteraeota bacterium]MBJ7613097.1 LysE family transporter [Candidatus Dormibacteraeota bacterium]